MSFKTVLVHVRSDAPSDALVQTAVAFALAHDADLIGLGARSSRFLADPTFAYLDAETVEMVLKADRAALDAAEQRFSGAAHPTLGGKAYWRALEETPNGALFNAAAGADLVLATLERGPTDSFVDVAALLCEIGLPVLAAPPAWGEVEGRSILIAWRNTKEVHRAVSMALPLLRRAARVSLVEVAPDAEEGLRAASVHAAAARLARHGVKAEAKVRVESGAVAQALLAEAQTQAADLLVLGAYGHSRAREWVLGGVTRSLMAAASLPLFLVH
jgi:nucleotide-binding universal stress UspA family protein